ncbi:MAG: restriction endonuclease subunit S [Halobacteriota archaeon]
MKISRVPITDIFSEISRGHYHATAKNLDAGKIPLVSCRAYNNGVQGYYDIPDDKTYIGCVTIASNGQPMTTFYHPYTFTADDDMLVCVPMRWLKLSTIYYVVAYLNKQQWRYSYGRKCFANKVDKIFVELPVTPDGEIDQQTIEDLIPVDIKSKIPERQDSHKIETTAPTFKHFPITALFTLERGDFHSISKLDAGGYRTVSRVTTNNGIVGYFEPPSDARIFPSGVLTISTVTGDAFVQYDDFIVTDNIVICVPLRDFSLTSLIFIQYMLNRQTWRYSYGRQCYKTKFANTTIPLPVDKYQEPDEEFMELAVSSTPYWKYLQSNTNGNGKQKGIRPIGQMSLDAY